MEALGGLVGVWACQQLPGENPVARKQPWWVEGGERSVGTLRVHKPSGTGARLGVTAL